MVNSKEKIPPPVYKIKDVSSLGTIKIKFDEPVLVPQSYLTFDYSKVLSITILSGLDGSAYNGQYQIGANLNTNSRILSSN